MRVPIAQRPKRVDSRHEFGHFESDTVIGTAPSKRCIDTQVERKSRRLFARFIEDKSALATARAEYDIYKDIPAPARIDRTWDNGTESSCHLLVDEALGMLTYYANPYSSYQRGTNENRNGRIRRYLPKKTSFDDLTDADLQAIVDEINDTPMKVLDWETPNEVWYRELGKVLSKDKPPKDGCCTYKLNLGFFYPKLAKDIIRFSFLAVLTYYTQSILTVVPLLLER